MNLLLQGLRFDRDAFRLGPIDLELPARQRSVLLGPSGCGKTTLLRLIAGLEDPLSGSIAFGDRSHVGEGRTVAPAERGLALVFQNLALWPHMKAWQQVDYAGRCGRDAAIALLERVGLHGLEDRLPGQLSGGEGQRVALARALAQKPELLLLDEPLRSVDPDRREELSALLVEIAVQESLTMLVVTHDREEAMRLGQHLVLMDHGRIVEEGSATELFTRPRTAFGARFLRRATLLSVEGEEGSQCRALVGRDLAGDPGEQGSTDAIASNGHGRQLSLGPRDLALADSGLEAELVEVHPGPEGPVGIARAGGLRLSVPLDREIPVGERVHLRLHGEPVFVTRKPEPAPRKEQGDAPR